MAASDYTSLYEVSRRAAGVLRVTTVSARLLSLGSGVLQVWHMLNVVQDWKPDEGVKQLDKHPHTKVAIQWLLPVPGFSWDIMSLHFYKNSLKPRMN